MDFVEFSLIEYRALLMDFIGPSLMEDRALLMVDGALFAYHMNNGIALANVG